MKKSIKQAAKKNTATNNKNKRGVAAKAGYKEEVYDDERQDSYQKSEAEKNKKKNTAGPED